MRRLLSAIALMALVSTPVSAANVCDALPGFDQLKSALTQARQQDNGGLHTDMWGAVVARDGSVCAVAYTGPQVDSQWPGSRAIAMEKANTANAFSLKGLSLSTANLYSATQPGGSLFGLANSDPADTASMHAGSVSSYGSVNDPMIGRPSSGIIVFGGGLALYNKAGDILGAVGVSGDTSCADHNIAWRTRNMLRLDYVPAGVASDKTDNIIYDIHGGKSAGGFGHPECGFKKEEKTLKKLPAVEK